MGDTFASVTFSPEEAAASRAAVQEAKANKTSPIEAVQKVLGNTPPETNPDKVTEKKEVTPPAERPAWLPEKFKSVEDMAKSYKELEAKLGGKKAEEPKAPEKPADKKTLEIPKEEKKPEGDATKQSGADATLADDALKDVGLNLEDFSKEYAEKGQLTEDSYKKLEAKGIPKATVDAFIAGQHAAAELANIKLLGETVGSQEKFNEMSQWAKTDWDGLDDYNAAIASANPAAVKLALNTLKAAYERSRGSEPRSLVGGKSSSGGESDVYDSRQQMVKDMQDKRYKTDPAFREKVAQKLARSNIW
jgi:hypothetical protein